MRAPRKSALLAEAALLWAIRAGLVLLLLTPLVVTVQTVFPWVVGKAVYARIVIEALFALWAALALVNPAFRPPRSWLLALLVLGFLWSVIAGGFGVSLVRSVWSNYERMQGLFDAAHWVALAVVLASTCRDTRSLLPVLNIHIGIGAAVALLAIARFHELPVPFYGALPEGDPRGIGGALGNALFLGGYAAVNAVLAIGLCVRCWFAGSPRPSVKRMLAMLCLGLAAYLNIHALALTGAMSAWLSLLVACAFAAFAYGIWGRSRRWRVAVLAATVAGLVCASALLALPQVGGKVFDRLVAVASDVSGQQRAAALLAGVAAFGERPLLGGGPENFVVAWGRHAGSEAGGEAHDSAHNRTLEEAVAKGVFGLGIYIALWVFAYVVLARRRQAVAETAKGSEGALLLTVGAALTCFFVNDQLRFPTTVLNLQQMLLFALVVNLEPTRQSSPAWERIGAPFRHVAARASVALVALAAAVAGLHFNSAIYAAAADIAKVGRPGRPGAYLERAIERFPPLANTPRVILIEQLAENWRAIRVRESAEALRLLALVEAEGRLAIAAEPANWEIHHALARLHTEVALGDPAHGPKAAHHLAKAKELAPNVAPKLVPGWWAGPRGGASARSGGVRHGRSKPLALPG